MIKVGDLIKQNGPANGVTCWNDLENKTAYGIVSEIYMPHVIGDVIGPHATIFWVGTKNRCIKHCGKKGNYCSVRLETIEKVL